MLLKCTADGRRIKVNGATVSQGNVARGMKMTMSTTSTMSSRIHRKVMRAPHKRALAGKIPFHPGKSAHHAGKMAHHPGKMAHHPGKFAHLGKFGKLAHYAQTHSLRPLEPCENSNDSGLGPDPDHRLTASRLSEPAEEWDTPGGKRRRGASETDVKIECDDANDAYPFPPPVAAPPPLPCEPAPAHLQTQPELIRAGCSLSSPAAQEAPGKRFQEPSHRPCTSGKMIRKFAGGGKLSTSGKLGGGKLGGKLGGKYGGKLAQALARRRALAMTGTPGLASPLTSRSRDGKVELQILCQPETQHRARYQTEGSRGAVKDNSGNGFPMVKLVGYDKPAVLQVYIGTDTGRVAPHMFYQACRVSGKNSTPCKERKEDGTVLIEVDLDPAKDWQVTCDCVGILKERNVDVEHRFGEALSAGPGAAHLSRGKKKSTRCRMVFRTEILNAEGLQETLQVCSTQIICTQPPGVPEVCRKSLVSCPATGGLELYLLGKNFLKESRVVFRQRGEPAAWEEEVAPDKEFLQQTHLVCCVPPYLRPITETVCVQLFVRSGGKSSEPHSFYYTPPALDTGPQHCTRHHSQGSLTPEGSLGAWAGGGMLPPPAPGAPPRRASFLREHEAALALKAEMADESSQHSLDGRDEPAEGVDLRLKAELEPPYIKLSPPPQPAQPPSPLATFTQQLQAIQNQVQTDKMVESVTAAIFNSGESAGQIYPAMEPALLPPAPPAPPAPLLQYERYNPFRALGEMELGARQIEHRLAQQSATMEALVEDAMKATAAMLPADAARLDELVNSRVEDHLGGTSPALGGPEAAPAADVLMAPAPPAPCEDLLMMGEGGLPSSVKTPPSAVKSMILTAAAEILTSDSTMNALVTSAINTANSLTQPEAPPPPGAPEPPPGTEEAEAPLDAMSQAVSQAVTQAVSQAVSQAVTQAVTQEMSAPVQGLSDSDLLSYINPSTFDQV